MIPEEEGTQRSRDHYYSNMIAVRLSILFCESFVPLLSTSKAAENPGILYAYGKRKSSRKEGSKEAEESGSKTIRFLFDICKKPARL